MPIDRKTVIEAVDEAKKNAKKRTFVQSVDLIIVLKDIDLKKPENRVNELVEVSHSPKSKVNVVVFAGGDLAVRADKAGADAILTRTDIERFRNDKQTAKQLVKNTDFFIAETSLMATIGKVLGPILGPRGKMPTPVPPTARIDTLIERHRKSVRIRIRDQPTAQVSVGTEEMSNDVLTDNILSVFTRLERRLERGLRNVRSAYIKTTMGPSIRLDYRGE
jgi:large subunit ribosomal protein L1